MAEEVYWVTMAIAVVFIMLAFMLGRQGSNLDRMEVTAAVATAKREVGWTYERYRLEALRMDWMALPEEARAQYCRMWGTPTWALPSHQRERRHP